MASPEDLAETVRLVEALDRRIVAARADVRDPASLRELLVTASPAWAGSTSLAPTPGICSVQPWDQVSPELWRDTLDTNLTGVWNTMVAAVPHLIEGGGGSMIATASTSGVKGVPFLSPYVAAKHGVVGIVRSLANELARHHIRVNTVLPAGVNTPMLMGLGALAPLLEIDPDLGGIFQNTLPVSFIESRDVSEAVLFLASDESALRDGPGVHHRRRPDHPMRPW